MYGGNVMKLFFCAGYSSLPRSALSAPLASTTDVGSAIDTIGGLPSLETVSEEQLALHRRG